MRPKGKQYNVVGWYGRALDDLEHITQIYSSSPYWAKQLPLVLDKLDYIFNNPTANPDMDWSDEHNVRGGAYPCIVGLMGEVKSAAILISVCGQEINIIQDRVHQDWLGIDILTAIGSIQCKTCQFKGQSLPTIYSSWTTHSADFTALVDHDDDEIYIVPRKSILTQKQLTKSWLKQNCVIYSYMYQIKVNNLHLVSDTKYESLTLPRC